MGGATRSMAIGTVPTRQLLARGLALAVIGTIGLAAQTAAARTCRTDAIATRFTEATRFCAPGASPGSSKPAAVPAGALTEIAPVEVVDRQSVSVRMPGYQQRLASASRDVRASGGQANSSALVTAIAHKYRINPRLLASMMQAESAGRQGAISNKGALGLMQVMPGTAREMGVRDPRAMLNNPVLALSTGAAYLKKLQGQLGNNVPLVVAAYNAGPGAVRKARGVPRYRETQGYVRKVMRSYAGTGAGSGTGR